MQVLVIGGGAREHALCWALRQSPRLSRLFCAPGNAGITTIAECVPMAVDAIDDIVAFAAQQKIDLVVIGPELPLIRGLADKLQAAGIAVFGPSAQAALLEGSKAYVKNLCREFSIPTATAATAHNFADAEKIIARMSLPIVVKADGLAAGKGVIIAATMAEATAAAQQLLAEHDTLVIEEFLAGEEISYFALVDGKTVVPLAAAQDHKRAYDGDAGPNTGGMGAYSPPPILDAATENKIIETIIRPTANAMVVRGRPFRGVLFAGLMLTSAGPKLLEYNVRFGDPECQAIMPRLDGDWLELLYGVATGRLAQMPQPRFKSLAALGVVMAARGYPGEYKKNTIIRNLAAAASLPQVQIFHAATQAAGADFTAQGGRVLTVLGLGDDVQSAQKHAYAAVDAIDWPDGFCRRDIGFRAVRVVSTEYKVISAKF
jgi:phosphoribosylamine---glycine ligase